jgi:hypothetical protein
VAGAEDGADVRQSFLQPFVSCTTPDAWTFTLRTESAYNWETEECAMPVNAVVSRVVTVGNRPVSFFGGLQYWAQSPAGGPDGWGVRFGATLPFARG